MYLQSVGKRCLSSLYIQNISALLAATSGFRRALIRRQDLTQSFDSDVPCCYLSTSVLSTENFSVFYMQWFYNLVRNETVLRNLWTSLCRKYTKLTGCQACNSRWSRTFIWDFWTKTDKFFLMLSSNGLLVALILDCTVQRHGLSESFAGLVQGPV